MVARLLALASALVTWTRALPPISLAAPALFGLVALVDALTVADTRQGVLPLLALAAGLSAGGLVGAIVGLAFLALARAHTAVRWCVWLLVGSVVAAWLCDSLGVWANLNGSYSRLARL